MRRPSAATLIACLALFFSLTGAGIAASRYIITSVHQIKPSVRHALRGEPGPRGVTGAPGQQGIPGATGPQGPAGTPASLQATAVSSAPVTLCASGDTCDVGAAIANCPSGTLAISGGIGNDSKPPTDMSISEDHVYGLQAGWLVTVTNNSDSPVSFHAVALCAAG